MTKYIDKDALVAEIKARIKDIEVSQKAGLIKKVDADKKILLLKSILSLIDTLEVKEVNNTPNIRFPHYKSIVEKVFGAGNLESFEYNEAEQLVLLAKEELLKDLEVKEMDFDAEWKKYFEYRGEMATVNVKHLAKHFFELSLKAQKGE